jgi:hypothetical protein
MLTSGSTLPEPIKWREYQRAASTLYPGDQDLAEELDAQRAQDPGSEDGQNNSDTGDKAPADETAPTPGKNDKTAT